MRSTLRNFRIKGDLPDMKALNKIAALLALTTMIFNMPVPVTAAEPVQETGVFTAIAALNSDSAILEDQFKPASEGTKPVLIFIQDAHSVADAQQSIRQTLHSLDEKLGSDN